MASLPRDKIGQQLLELRLEEKGWVPSPGGPYGDPVWRSEEWPFVLEARFRCEILMANYQYGIRTNMHIWPLEKDFVLGYHVTSRWGDLDAIQIQRDVAFALDHVTNPLKYLAKAVYTEAEDLPLLLATGELHMQRGDQFAERVAQWRLTHGDSATFRATPSNWARTDGSPSSVQNSL